MFGKKKTVALITLTEEKLSIKGNTGSIEEIHEMIKGLAMMIEEQTGIRATHTLTKCTWDLLD